MRAAPPGGKAGSKPLGLTEPEQRSVVAALEQSPNHVNSLSALAIEKHLGKLQEGAWDRQLPDEVELYAPAKGPRLLVETFPDSGSCRDHFVGLARRTPLAKDGAPLRDQATFFVGGSSVVYERGLAAWIKGDVVTALRYLAPSGSWTVPMMGSLRGRLSQAFYADPLLKKKLPPWPIKIGQTVTLLDEPHPSGRVVMALTGQAPPPLPPGQAPPPGGLEPQLRRVLTPRREDGYRRFDTAAGWELVAVPGSWVIGFAPRRPPKTPPTPAGVLPATAVH